MTNTPNLGGAYNEGFDDGFEKGRQETIAEVEKIYQELEDSSMPMGLSNGKPIMGIDRRKYLRNKQKLKEMKQK